MYTTNSGSAAKFQTPLSGGCGPKRIGRRLNGPNLGWKSHAKAGNGVTGYLLLAFVMEALILHYVPQEAVAQILGSRNWFAIPLSALIGIPLYLTEISALPIVSELLAQGMVPGAAIAFLIAGPVTTLPVMTAVFGIVNRRIFPSIWRSA